MYPQVFEDYATFCENHGDVSVLPSPAFFYGLCQDEEILVHIQEGKTLIIRFLHQTDPNSDGERTLIFELNGVARHVKILDTSIRTEKKSRPKADEKDDAQVGAPMPGLVASLAVSVGSKVSEGDALLTLEAMKMFTTITAPKDGTVAELHADSGETVESGDLLLTLS
ncbi:MAG: pyruvate carboxylase, partial [Verrucomicrobiaceae bacterium]|nr:pyruvate carboxylase [Verrucomicrobiaceae bacterium]